MKKGHVTTVRPLLTFAASTQQACVCEPSWSGLTAAPHLEGDGAAAVEDVTGLQGGAGMGCMWLFAWGTRPEQRL